MRNHRGAKPKAELPECKGQVGGYAKLWHLRPSLWHSAHNFFLKCFSLSFLSTRVVCTRFLFANRHSFRLVSSGPVELKFRSELLSASAAMARGSRLTRLDAFSKTVEDARVRTTSGGIVTMVSVIIVVFLVIGEFRDYRRIIVQPELVVDKGRGEVCDPLNCLADKVYRIDMRL